MSGIAVTHAVDSASGRTERMWPGASLRMVIGAALAALILCVLFGQVSVTLKALGAAPGGESNISNLLYRLHPMLLRVSTILGGLMIVAMGYLAAGQYKRRSWLEVICLLLGAAAVGVTVWPFARGWAAGLALEQMPIAGSALANVSLAALACACVAWVTVTSHQQVLRVERDLEYRAAEQRIRQCMSAVRPRQLLAFVPAFLLTAGLVSLAGSLGETIFHILPTMRRFQLTGAAAGYLATSLGVALFFGLLHAVTIMNLFLALFLLFRGLHAVRMLRRGACLFLAAGGGLYVYLFGYNGVMSVFGDEISELGFGALAIVTFASFSLLYAALVAWNLVELCRQAGRPRDFSDLIRLYLLAAFLPLIGPVVRLARRRIRPGKAAVATAAMLILLLMVLLIQASFPTLVDHTSRAVVLWATGVTVAAIFGAYILFPPRPQGWPKRLAVLAVLVAAAVGLLVTAGSSSPVRTLFYEYAAISRAQWQTVDVFCPAAGCRWASEVEPAAPPPKPQRPPLPEPIRRWRQTRPLIVLVIWDAARRDHLGLYGHRRRPAGGRAAVAPPAGGRTPLVSTTPHLDALRDELTWFEPAYSQATATTCSMRHIFTGRRSSRFMLKQEGIAPFFTNELIRAGYVLHLNIIGTDYNGVSKEAFLRDMPPDVAQIAQVTCCFDENEPNACRDLLAFLDRGGRRQGVFAYIHMTATHFPWRKYPGGIDFGTTQADLYDQAISFCDKVTGELIDGLKRRGLWDNTVFILTADHGTGLGEHGRVGGFHPYREQIAVPLVLRVPGVARGKVSAMVGGFDIAPTLVEPFFPDRLGRYHARSLWPILLHPDAPRPPRVLFGMSSFEDCYFLVTDAGLHYTWHRGRRYELLFNCRRDPAELNSLLDDRPRLAQCRAWMAWYLRNGKGEYTNPYHYREAPEK